MKSEKRHSSFFIRHLPLVTSRYLPPAVAFLVARAYNTKSL